MLISFESKLLRFMLCCCLDTCFVGIGANRFAGCERHVELFCPTHYGELGEGHEGLIKSSITKLQRLVNVLVCPCLVRVTIWFDRGSHGPNIINDIF